MRLRNVKGSREMIATNDFVVHEEETMKGKWHDFLKMKSDSYRSGNGKGRFIIDMAKLHPEINYIGIEKYSSVLVRAIEKQTIEQLPNLVFIRMDAEAIENVFEKDEVAYIYLNFSDPWPKDRHARRRLTSVQFLNRYVNFLAADGGLTFKTDNRPLFDFSLEQVELAGWEMVNYTFDLHHSEYAEGNVMTEYEEKFSAMGNPICRMVIKPPKKK